MKIIISIIVLSLLFGCTKEQDESIVPKTLPNGFIAILKSGRNWPEGNFQPVTQALINNRSVTKASLNLSIKKRELYTDSQYIDREGIYFSSLPPSVGKISFKAVDEIRRNSYRDIELPNASLSIVHEDELHALYSLDSSHDNYIEIVDIDQQNEKVKAKFDVKLSFSGSDNDWEKARKEFNDVSQRSFIIRGEFEISGFIYFK